jgi:AcrR family transcriptional regulator
LLNRKTLILDTAERLFAERGFDGVSVRDVATAGPVGLGLITHHFPSKEMLFEAVVARRAESLNDARREALNALRDPALEDILRAFVGPYRDFIETGGPGWRAYARLIALITQDARWTALAARFFSDLGRDVIERMKAAEPGLTRTTAVRGYVHLVAVMIGMFASTGLLDRFSDGELSSEDISANFEPMIRFAAGGIRALAREPESDAADRSAA